MSKIALVQKNIPDGWGVVPAGAVFDFVKSYALSRDALISDTSNKEGIGNIHYGDLHATYSNPSIDLRTVSVPMVKDPHFTPKASDFLRDGDLIMADASEDYEGVGVTVSLHGLEDKKIVGGLHTFVLRDEKGKTDEYYRQYIFRNPRVRNTLQKIANGVSVYGVSKKAISKVLLPLPPLPEQKRIVAVLETWDRAIEKLKRKIELKKEVKRGLMQELLTGRIRLPGFKDKWQVVKFGSLFNERSERGMKGLPLLSITGGRGVIYQSDSNKKDSSNLNKSKYLHICPGDIGYNTMRMWQGRSALSGIEGLVSPAYTILSPRENVDSRYFAYLFKIPRVVDFFFQKSQGLVSDTWQCRYKDFAIVKYSIPGYPEQSAIANILAAADKEVTELEKKLSLLEEQKRYLLNNLITGVIRTPETMNV